MDDLRKLIQDWIDVEKREGRSVDENRLNQYIQLLVRRHNNAPHDDFNGLSPEQMRHILYAVELNTLTKEQ